MPKQTQANWAHLRNIHMQLHDVNGLQAALDAKADDADLAAKADVVQSFGNKSRCGGS